MIKALKTIFVIYCLCAAMSCASTPKPTQQINPKATDENHYVTGWELQQHHPIEHQDPLPNEVPIYIEWHYNNGDTRQVLAYKGWDFNKDGRIEMLEVLTLDGESLAFAYDFDGDGQIDLIKKNGDFSLDLSEAQNMPAPPSRHEVVKKPQKAYAH